MHQGHQSNLQQLQRLWKLRERRISAALAQQQSAFDAAQAQRNREQMHSDALSALAQQKREGLDQQLRDGVLASSLRAQRNFQAALHEQRSDQLVALGEAQQTLAARQIELSDGRQAYRKVLIKQRRGQSAVSTASATTSEVTSASAIRPSPTD